MVKALTRRHNGHGSVTAVRVWLSGGHGGVMSLRRGLVWALSVVALFCAPPAFAQDSAGLQREFDALYQQVLFTPSNAALNRRLIDLAVTLQDYDAAIGAVERLIFNDPNNVDLYLEVARLYLKIQSPAAAKGYLDDALKIATIAPAKRGEVQALLDQIERGSRPSGWNGLFQAGLRFQTNGNVGSAEPGVNENFFFERPLRDYNSFALATLGYVRQVSRLVTLEFSASGYYADQAVIDRLDLGFGELTAGPRISGDDGSLWVKPYAIVQGVLLGDHPYQQALGGGITGRRLLADGDWWADPTFEYKSRRYRNSAEYPNAEDQNSNLFSYTLTLGNNFTDNVIVSRKLGFVQNRAELAYNSYDQFSGSISAIIDRQDRGGRQWIISPFANLAYFQYKGLALNEELQSPQGPVRRDLQWSIGTNVEAPFFGRSRLGIQVQYTSNISNLDRYVSKNFVVMAGPLARF